jgi:hypothetical protein
MESLRVGKMVGRMAVSWDTQWVVKWVGTTAGSREFLMADQWAVRMVESWAVLRVWSSVERKVEQLAVLMVGQ